MLGLCYSYSPRRCIYRWRSNNNISIHGELIATCLIPKHQTPRHTQTHKPIWTSSQSQSGLMAFGFVCLCDVCASSVLPISTWLCISAKCKQLSRCDVWIGDDNPGLWMRSTESNLLCFLCAPQVHFLSSTIQTRQMTEYPSLSLFLFYPLTFTLLPSLKTICHIL